MSNQSGVDISGHFLLLIITALGALECLFGIVGLRSGLQQLQPLYFTFYVVPVSPVGNCTPGSVRFLFFFLTWLKNCCIESFSVDWLKMFAQGLRTYVLIFGDCLWTQPVCCVWC